MLAVMCNAHMDMPVELDFIKYSNCAAALFRVGRAVGAAILLFVILRQNILLQFGLILMVFLQTPQRNSGDSDTGIQTRPSRVLTMTRNLRQ